MRKYHSNDPSTGKPWTKDESSMYLEQCIKASEEIMNSGIYSLTDDAASRKTQYSLPMQMPAEFMPMNSYGPVTTTWICRSPMP